MKKTWIAGVAMAQVVAHASTLAIANAQIEEADAEERVEDVIIVTGTRRQSRSALDSPAPIDVISADELTNQADNDIQNILRTSIPSYNVNTQPISDAATLVRPANMRGLSPDNTLVLVNNKRHHRAAVIAFLGGGIADGSQGPDISSIPAIALKQVEVLRDGASSQYGSDAIAGVINFILRDDTEGGQLEVKHGQTYQGDGENVQIAANLGLRVGQDGFMNLSAEYQDTSATSRSVQRDDAQSLISAGNKDVRDPAQIWGQPEIRGDFKILLNTGVALGGGHELYGFGSFAQRETEGGFFFRNPTNRGGVFRGPTLRIHKSTFESTGAIREYVPNSEDVATEFFNVNTIRVGDMGHVARAEQINKQRAAERTRRANLGPDDPQPTQTVEEQFPYSKVCPAGIPLVAARGSTDNLLPHPQTLAEVLSEENCWSFVEMFPGGFTPSFGGELEDMSMATGIRGEFDVGTGLSYDFSYSFGENTVNFFIKNTVNASLGANSPNLFRPGGYVQTENMLNIDFGYGFPIEGFASDLNVGFGYENRKEEFEIIQGDANSWARGPLTTPSAIFPVGQGFSSSSNGFGGFTDKSAGKSEQTNDSYYVDMETDIVESFTVQGAVRQENYTNYGKTTNYKIGGLWRANETVRIRSTFSTGFHAPTTGQANVVNVTTQFTGGVLADSGTFPLQSAAGQLVADYLESQGKDRPTLNPEESENFTIGAGFEFEGFTVSFDVFHIILDNRIARSSDQPFEPALRWLAKENDVLLQDDWGTTEILTALDNRGVVNQDDFRGSEDLTSFAYFENAFDTTTQGIDFVMNGPVDFGGTGYTTLGVAINYTRNKVERNQPTVAAHRVRQLEENLPRWRGNVTINHFDETWRGLLRINYFGSFYEAHLDDGGLPIEAGSEITFDGEFAFIVNEGTELVFGGRNMFDSFPDDNPYSGIAGSRYPATAPNGFSGGQWYIKARYSW